MPNLEALQAPQELLILGAATRCGIIDRIWAKGKSSAAELAAELELDLRATWTVTEALIALGYLTREPAGGREHGLLSLTPEARALLFDTGSKSYIGRSYMHAYGMVGSWYQLPAVIKTGKSVPRESDTKHTVAFMHAMRRSGGPAAAAITKTAAQGLPAPFRVLDLGGGPLTHARAFAALGGRVTVLDTTPVVEMMGPELKPDEPVTLVGGDFTRELPPGPFNLAYLGNITHIYGAEINRRIFRLVAGVLVPGGRIAITDFIRGEAPFAAVFAVNMLVNTENGGTWTGDEYRDWLSAAGFGNCRVHEIEGRQLILADLTAK